MPRPRFRLTCCLCGKPVAGNSDVYDLDEEWQRRFPSMVGTLACEKCAVGTPWFCRTRNDRFVRGHIRANQPEARDFDSWSHLGPPGTQVASIQLNPWAGLLQGAEEYLRYTAHRSGLDPEVAQWLQDALERWDAQAPSRGRRERIKIREQ